MDPTTYDYRKREQAPTQILGNLWMGGYPHDEERPQFSYILACCDTSYIELPRQNVIRAPFGDSRWVDDGLVEGLSDLVKHLLGWKRPVLVHCSQGRNRSGLITARTLMKCGLTSVEAIQLIKQKRPYAFSNDYFVSWLTGLDDQERRKLWVPEVKSE